MVDTKFYQILHRFDGVATGSARTELDAHTMLDDNLPEAAKYPYFVLLLPANIKGFGFHNKKWSKLKYNNGDCYC